MVFGAFRKLIRVSNIGNWPHFSTLKVLEGYNLDCLYYLSKSVKKFLLYKNYLFFSSSEANFILVTYLVKQNVCCLKVVKNSDLKIATQS